MAIIKSNNNFFFPASRVKRYYYPSTTSTYGFVSFVSVTNNITYYPIYISKYIINPNFCLEYTSGGGTVEVGIYDAKDGFENANLLWKGTITATAGAGTIAKVNSNIRLKEGWYIIGALNTSLSGTFSCRTPATNYYRVLFGERTDIAIGGGLGSSHYTQIAATLPQNIGSGTNILVVTTAAAPLIALEY